MTETRAQRMHPHRLYLTGDLFRLAAPGAVFRLIEALSQMVGRTLVDVRPGPDEAVLSFVDYAGVIYGPDFMDTLATLARSYYVQTEVVTELGGAFSEKRFRVVCPRGTHPETFGLRRDAERLRDLLVIAAVMRAAPIVQLIALRDFGSSLGNPS